MTVLLAPSVLSNVSLDLSVAGRTASGGFNHEPHTLTQRRETHTHQQEQPQVNSTTHSKGKRDTESLESTEKTMADYETTGQ